MKKVCIKFILSIPVIIWQSIIGIFFNSYKDKVIPFAFDWMGRQFVLDKDNVNKILMFDPATAEDFEVWETLDIFHNNSLVEDKLHTLSSDTFHEGLNFLKKDAISYNECIGYTKPLLLGGVDSIENLEVSDIEVYWELQLQIYRQIKNLPPGTKLTMSNLSEVSAFSSPT